MGCHKPWDRIFLDDHLTKSWREHELREHRGAVLFDRERARFPETQTAVAVEREKRKAAMELEKHRPRLQELKAAYTVVNQRYRDVETAIWKKRMDIQKPPVGSDPAQLQTELDVILEEWRKVSRGRRAAKRALNEFEATLEPILQRVRYGEAYTAPPALRALGLENETPISLVERGMYTWEQLGEMGVNVAIEQAKIQKRHQFVAACPKETCRGFLSTAYKCGTCDDYFCSKCRVHLGAEKDPTHACDPALLATIQAILADSKPCPTCGTAISRVSGCDQMYCTQCDTPFSYKTGERVTGAIHNPHYFARLAALGAAAPAGDQDPCGNGALNERFRQVNDLQWVVNRYLVYNHKAEAIPTPYMSPTELRYLLGDIRDRTLAEYPDPRTQPNYETLRVRYMLNDYDEKEFKQKLATQDRERARLLEVRAVLETAVLLLMDVMLALPYPNDEGVGQAFRERFNTSDWLIATRAGTMSKSEERYAAAIACHTVFSNRITGFLEKMEELVNTPLRAIADRYQNIVPVCELINDSHSVRVGRYLPKKVKKGSPVEPVAAAGGGH